jgi:4-hydroxy-2-oxoheptanedioate aldolase
MSELSIVPARLNGVVRTLESGAPAFVSFSPPGAENGFAIAESPYDGVVFEMEHDPFSAGDLHVTLQSMLNRRQIAQSASVAPGVTPFVRIPPNGSDMNTWVAKQVLDSGVYSAIWPHISTVEEAQRGLRASAREHRERGATCRAGVPLAHGSASAGLCRGGDGPPFGCSSLSN